MPPTPTRHDIRIETVTGAELRGHLPRLGELRAEVFRAWPYLYEGEFTYETQYGQAFATSPRAGLVLAWAADTIVGAATCIPLDDEDFEVRAPFLARGYDLRRFFYFGESVLLAPWRGIGIGVDFFRYREAHAMSVSDADFACFCAVQRPDTHPGRPTDATTLEPFWQRRGYTKRPELVCHMSWLDVGDVDETVKPLVFWMKSLRGTPLP